MHMTGEQRIAASRQRVWEALNDPTVLKACIPGCQSLERDGPDRLKATVEVKIGPIGARFEGAVGFSDLDPPNGYTLNGEGSGGIAGFAKGGAKVRLSDDGGGTLLTYEVDAQVGGRLAQLGGPIIDATAKQLAAKFFAQLGEAIAGPGVAPASAKPVAAATPASATSVPRSGGLPVAWILAVALAALVGFLVGRGQGDGSDWMGLSIGLLVVIVAAAGFEFGRRSAPVVTLDPALLAKLIEGARR